MPRRFARKRRRSLAVAASLACAIALSLATVAPGFTPANADAVPGWDLPDDGVTSFIQPNPSECTAGVDRLSGEYFAQGWTVIPPGVHHALVTAVGEAGTAGVSNGAVGGLGGEISAIVPATPGENFYASPTSSVTQAAVEEEPGNDYANGGHASFISTVSPTTYLPTTASDAPNPDTLCFAEYEPRAYSQVMPTSDLVLVGGGGGGGGPLSGSGVGGNAGPNGSPGGNANGAGGGGGGTQTAAGAGGTGQDLEGSAGDYLAGGEDTGVDHAVNSGGGGGAGFFGGGSGGIGVARGGGGGGSNYVMPLPNDGVSKVISNGTSTLTPRVSILPDYEPTVTLSAPQNASAVGVPTTVTVTLSGLPVGTSDRPGAAGTVSLLVDGNAEETRPLDPLVGADTGVRTATFTPTEATPGTVSYSATYNGDTSEESAGFFAYVVQAENSNTVQEVYKAAATASIDGTMTFGDSGASFSLHNSLPTGVTISGTVTCTTADGGKAFSTLSAGNYALDPTSCSGLTLGGANASNYVLAYTGNLSVDPKVINVTITGSQPNNGSPTFQDAVSPASAASLVSGTPTCTTLNDGTAIGPGLARGAYTLGACAGPSLDVTDPGDYAFSVIPGQYIVGVSAPTLTIPPITDAVAGSAIDPHVTVADGDDPEGKVSLSFYDDNDCSGSPLQLNTASISDNGDYGTQLVTPSHAGDFSMRATYPGDVFNAPAVSDCEVVTVGVALAGAGFTIPATGLVGQPLSASATFSSPVAWTGSDVTFILFPTTDLTCTGQTALLDVSYPVTADGTYTSTTYTPTTPGTYRWVILYPGDANHAAQDAVCHNTMVSGPPNFTSPASTTFIAGTSGSFTVATSGGSPQPTTLSESGTLPDGVTFTDSRIGTATLAGIPTNSSAGTYPFTITASNSRTSSMQSFVLTVAQSPTITSASNTTFTAGESSLFTVTTTVGFPSSTALSESGNLPTGVEFADNNDGTATFAGVPDPRAGGSYPLTITADNGTAPTSSQHFVLTVAQSPVITSTNNSTFAGGASSSFTVTSTAGFPTTTTLSEQGDLPAGIQFTDNRDGTATLAGTPDAVGGGSYPLTITAGNGTAPDSSQHFVLVVTRPVAITDTAQAVFQVGANGTHAVTTTAGYPTSSTLTLAGDLPTGVFFTDSGNGEGSIAGTPAVGSGGLYPVTITADNAVGTPAIQHLDITVNESPAITSGDSTTFTSQLPGSATITTAAGFPTSTTLSESGQLPDGVTFVDNGNGTVTMAGTPGATTAGSYPLTITASNGAAPDVTQDFVLTVVQPPTITSTDNATFAAGDPSVFGITTTTGFPTTTTLSESGNLPAGISFTDHHDGTASIAGTPDAAAGGSFPLTITAGNGISPDATQHFTLVITRSIVIGTAAQAVFQVGQSGTHAVTTIAGYPTSSTLTLFGTLPSGLSFTDAGDGTGTLSGTPDVGTGGSYAVTVTASNGIGTPSVQDLVITVNESPTITSADTWSPTIGVISNFAITTSPGYPATDALGESGALPPGLSLAISGGSATITGVPSGPSGSFPITLTASNTVAPDTVQTLTIVVTDAAAVPLPLVLPGSGGSLTGVPVTSHPGGSFTASATGFAPGAPITWGIYSTPHRLATSVADPSGDATATLAIPGGFAGAHIVVATGIAPDGTPLIATAGTTVLRPLSTAQLPTTGVSVGASPAAAILLLVLGLALVLIIRLRRLRSRS
ncbi:MAG TPA: putative Ig domain-containing protein [Galbitalea sp.]|jgi:hypothetical protein|nr:putative Ig domain-containing protein [Galbitalea sp.]